MKKFLLFLFCVSTWSSIALAECSATSFIRDFRNDFQSRNGAFDWCFERVQWWGLDTSDGWRDRFCQVHQLGQYRWQSQFFHQHKVFKSRYSSGIFFEFEKFYSQRVFQGFPAGVHLIFSDRCDYYGYD